MVALVGYTGFVGSNIYEKGQIDKAYNSKNVEAAYGLEPDILIYSGVSAEKYLANHLPDEDMTLIEQAENNIAQIAPKQLILISTIDVFSHPHAVNENTIIRTDQLQAYGLHRRKLECWVQQRYPNALIIRLPALFGKNIKKNFIYDYINVIPFMLKEEKLEELSKKDDLISKYYIRQNNGFYQCKKLDQEEKRILKKSFHKLNFTALNFTDSRNSYQFYPLDRLWDDIQAALNHNIRTLHLATEPVSASELYYYLTGNVFWNELAVPPVSYDFRTIHASVWNQEGYYIMKKKAILQSIKKFVGGYEDVCE